MEKDNFMVEPREGLLTFRAEDNNIPGNRHYSRIIHWPGIASRCEKYGSGVTIGRGYDMKHRSSSEIIRDLISAGISLEKAKKISEGSRKSHCIANEFVRKNRNKIEEITESQQLILFEVTCKNYVYDSMRFYNKYKKIDSVSWGELHPILKDVFVDMKYQGSLSFDMVEKFGLNNKGIVIHLIQNDPNLVRYEKSRGRVSYIKENMQCDL